MPWRSIGVNLNDDQRRELEAIAKAVGVTRNAVLRFAIAWFLREYQAGKINLRKYVEPTRRLKPP